MLCFCLFVCLLFLFLAGVLKTGCSTSKSCRKCSSTIETASTSTARCRAFGWEPMSLTLTKIPCLWSGICPPAMMICMWIDFRSYIARDLLSTFVHIYGLLFDRCIAVVGRFIYCNPERRILFICVYKYSATPFFVCLAGALHSGIDRTVPWVL